MLIVKVIFISWFFIKTSLLPYMLSRVTFLTCEYFKKLLRYRSQSPGDRSHERCDRFQFV